MFDYFHSNQIYIFTNVVWFRTMPSAPFQFQVKMNEWNFAQFTQRSYTKKPHSHSINDLSITYVASQNEWERHQKINKSKVCRIFSQQPQKQYTKSDVVVTNMPEWWATTITTATNRKEENDAIRDDILPRKWHEKNETNFLVSKQMINVYVRWLFMNHQWAFAI